MKSIIKGIILNIIFSISAAQNTNNDYLTISVSTYENGFFSASTFGNTSDPAAFFKNQTDYTLTQFLKKYPKAFYGLFYRASFDNHTYFNEWKLIAHGKNKETQLTLHLQADSVAKPTQFFSPYCYKDYIIKAWEKEKKLGDSHYFFYHGQQAFFGFIQEFTTELIEELFNAGYLKKTLPNDFFFIQNPNWINKIVNQSTSDTFLQAQKQEQLAMMQGRFFQQEPKRKSNRLAANAFLFANSDRRGSCTWNFVVNNNNINYYNPNIYIECFKKLSLKNSLYQNYKNEINKLKNEYNQFYTSGRLLQIAIPKTIIDECVYLASDGAYKDPVYTKNGTKVETVSEFFKHFFNNDFTVLKVHSASGHLRPGIYEVEFALPLTVDKILNPYNGVKVFGYNNNPLPQITTVNGFLGSTTTYTYQEHKNRRRALCKKIAHKAMK